MPRSKRGNKFELWRRHYFRGVNHQKAWAAWHTAQWAVKRPDYPEELRKADRESGEWRRKYERALEEIDELKRRLGDRAVLINEFLLRGD
jgi:hypothetical protein